ncbi:hypothetical protein [Deinococcus ruber]|uniref:hypothetical protein n=1 Tax=Deinococcus ruber TaxID=1848197 RepID=UPI001662D740|nr:hypothetical protein [Deinococcus ruber]
MALPFVDSERDVLNLFDTEISALDQNFRLRSFLREREAEQEQRPTDLIIYYVGHGSFGYNNNEYFLTLRTTLADDPYTFSFSLRALANILRTHARTMRRYLILDACFAAAAAPLMSDNDAVRRIEKSTITNTAWASEYDTANQAVSYGTTLLCASSKDDPAYFGEELTHFTEALLLALQRGDPLGGPLLSIQNVRDLAWRHLRELHADSTAHPEIHSPDQRGHADIGRIGLFPNPSAGLPNETIEPQLVERIDVIINEYRQVRDGPRDDQRILKMERIAKRMRFMATDVMPMLPELANSTSSSRRLFAVMLLQVQPRREYLVWLSERFRADRPFVQYQAARALSDASRTLNPEFKSQLLDTIAYAKSLLSDDRDQTRTRILNEAAIDALRLPD